MVSKKRGEEVAEEIRRRRIDWEEDSVGARSSENSEDSGNSESLKMGNQRRKEPVPFISHLAPPFSQKAPTGPKLKQHLVAVPEEYQRPAANAKKDRN